MRHVVEDLGSVCPCVQILDLPMPQMMDQFAELLNLEEDVLDAGRLVDPYFQVPELVIEVPKFIIEDVPMRTSDPEPQLAEQLVEVPTILSYSSLQRSVEQLVDIPVPGGGGPSFGLQGFSSGQRSTASPSKKRISERIVEQIVDPVSRGSLPGSSSSHSPAGDEERADEPGKGVFHTFPQNKKSAKGASHSGSELLPESSPSTPAAQLEGSVEWVRLRERHAGKTYFWNRRTNSTVWRAPAGVEVVWYGEKDEEGGVWYWHRDTRATTFELPPLPPE